MTYTARGATIGDELARKIVAAADVAARETEHRFAVAVVDAGGHLIALVRQDGAPLNAIHIAQDKAYTAPASR
jgi:uncharacterized protein GlcG (DUF336 family)